MVITVVEEDPTALADYATVPIAFTVQSRLYVDALEADDSTSTFVEEPVPHYVKDYDAEFGEGPRHWAARWDLTNWTLFGAFDAERRVGGAVLAWRTADLLDLGGRDDLAVLWDLRVHPDLRGRGVGRALFEAAIARARRNGCTELRVETQDINVPACRFYARQGCRVTAIDRCAYPGLDEVQLWWTLDLTDG